MHEDFWFGAAFGWVIGSLAVKAAGVAAYGYLSPLTLVASVFLAWKGAVKVIEGLSNR
jgi:hypothetical protein